MLAKAVANESDTHYLSINGPEIMSRYYEKSEKRIREIFDGAEMNAPAVPFLYEIESIAPMFLYPSLFLHSFCFLSLFVAVRLKIS